MPANIIRKEQVVIEVSLIVDNAGTIKTFYFTDGSGFATRPDETPPDTWFQPRVKNAGNIQRDMWTGGKTSGPIRGAFGEIILENKDGGLDEWINYNIDGQKIVIRFGAEGTVYPSAYQTVLVIRGSQLVVDYNEVRIKVKDRTDLFDRPVLNETFKGTGGLEGTPDLAGKLKPRGFGEVQYVPVTLVDPQKLIYHVTEGYHHSDPLFRSVRDGSYSQDSVKVTEGGAPIEHEMPTNDLNFFLTNPPANGKCRVYYDVKPKDTTGKGRVYIRLGSPPLMELRVFAHAYVNILRLPIYLGKMLDTYPNASLASIDYWPVIPDIANIFEQDFGHITSVDVDFTSFLGPTAPLAGYFYIRARYVDDSSTTYASLFDDAFTLFNGSYGFNRKDQLYCFGLENPASKISKYVFNQHNARGFVRQNSLDSPSPYKGVQINMGETWPVSQIARGLTAAEIAAQNAGLYNLLYPSREVFTKTGYRLTYSEDFPSVSLNKYPSASVLPIESLNSFGFTQANAAGILRAAATNIKNLFGVPRELFSFVSEMNKDTINLDLGDVINLQLGRFGLSSGKNFMIVSIRYDLSKREISYTVWG